MSRHRRLIDEGGSLLAGKPAAKVRERHGHGVGDNRLPGGPVRPAAHRPPGHHSRLGLIDKEPSAVRPRIGLALGFYRRDHKAIQRATLGHRAAPGRVWHGSRVRRRPLGVVALRGSIPQTWLPAQGSARAVAERQSSACSTHDRACLQRWLIAPGVPALDLSLVCLAAPRQDGKGMVTIDLLYLSV